MLIKTIEALKYRENCKGTASRNVSYIFPTFLEKDLPGFFPETVGVH